MQLFFKAYVLKIQIGLAHPIQFRQFQLLPNGHGFFFFGIPPRFIYNTRLTYNTNITYNSNIT